jgi:hypothetical protein
MCIICNAKTSDFAVEFLSQFDRSRSAMQSAATAMLECSRNAATPDSKKRYDMTHKAMMRLIRDWNRLEQVREAGRSTNLPGGG